MLSIQKFRIVAKKLADVVSIPKVSHRCEKITIARSIYPETKATCKKVADVISIPKVEQLTLKNQTGLSSSPEPEQL